MAASNVNAAVLAAFIRGPAGIAVAVGALVGFVYNGGPQGDNTLLQLGLLILDKESNQFKFSALSEKNAKMFGITESEREAFNFDLDRVNGANEELNLKIDQSADSEKVAVAKDSLSDFEAQISPEAFSAVKKFVKASYKK